MAIKTTSDKRFNAPAKPIVKRQDANGGPAGDGAEPHLPHEADQSSSNQSSNTPQNVRTGRQAKADVDRGMVDTGRAPVVDKVYREHFDPPRKTTRRPKPPTDA